MHPIRKAVLAIPLLAVGACAAASERDFAVGETPKRLEVEWSRKTHLATFELREAALPETAKAELAGFVRQNYAGPDDRILVNPGVALEERRDLLEARGRAVQNFLADLGYASNVVSSNAGVEGTVIVAVERYAVRLPDCPDRRRAPPLTNAVSSNYGCANAVNLGQMIADPRDLVTGRDLGPMDGIYAASGVERYRKGEIKELKTEETTDENGGQ